MPPALGVILPTMAERRQPVADVVSAARHAEDLGFESAWAIDQLVAGTGVPFLDGTVALSAAAERQAPCVSATASRSSHCGPWPGRPSRSRPLATHLWRSCAVRGRRRWRPARPLLGCRRVPRAAWSRTDAALRVLPDLIAGNPVDLEGTTLTAAPGVTVPPIIVRGMADAALARAARYADGWYALPSRRPCSGQRRTAGGEGADLGRPVATITRLRHGRHRGRSDASRSRPVGSPAHRPRWGVRHPREAVGDTVLQGDPAAVAERIDELAPSGRSGSSCPSPPVTGTARPTSSPRRPLVAWARSRPVVEARHRHTLTP